MLFSTRKLLKVGQRIAYRGQDNQWQESPEKGTIKFDKDRKHYYIKWDDQQINTVISKESKEWIRIEKFCEFIED